jgi:hypothetical protein
MSFKPKRLGIDGTMCFAAEDEFELLFLECPKKKPGETQQTPRSPRLGSYCHWDVPHNSVTVLYKHKAHNVAM